MIEASRKLIGAAILLGLALAAPACADDILSNGHFDDAVAGVFSDWTSNAYFQGGPAVDIVWDGQYSLGIASSDGHSAGSLSQSFSDQAGTYYEVDFEVTKSWDGGAGPLTVSAGAKSLTLTAVDNIRYWYPQSFTFLGTGEDALTISTTSSADDWRIDGISLAATTPPPVPEPAAWILMLVGFGSTGLAMRRQRPLIRA